MKNLSFKVRYLGNNSKGNAHSEYYKYYFDGPVDEQWFESLIKRVHACALQYEIRNYLQEHLVYKQDAENIYSVKIIIPNPPKINIIPELEVE